VRKPKSDLQYYAWLQVEQILDIFECAPGGAEEQLDFDQFYGRVVAFLGGEGAAEEVAGPALLLSPATQPPPVEQGEFNENLRRSFEKSTSSPAKSPNKKLVRNTRRKSQVSGHRCKAKFKQDLQGDNFSY
jgi:hypothetical protein